MRSRSFLVVALCVALFLQRDVSSQAGVITAVVAGKVAGTVIKDASDQAQSLLLSAEQNANAAIAKLSNELSVAAENARLAISQDLDKKIGALSDENAKLLAGLDRMLEATRKIQIGVVDLKDSSVLDLKDLMGDTWLTSGHTPFFVQRIDGIAQLQRATGADYRVGLLGLGFGPNSSYRINEISAVTLGGKTIDVRHSEPRANYTELTIPGTLIAERFRSKKLVTLPLQVSVTVKTKGWFAWLRGWDQEAHALTVNLALLSRYAGHVVVSYEEPKIDWKDVPNGADVRYTATSPNVGDSGRWNAWLTETRVPENQRFVAPTFYTHSGPGCGWTRGWAVNITEQSHKLVLTMEIQGASCNHTYGARLQELGPVGSQVGKNDYDIEYGKVLVIDLPINATFWRVQGTSATFEQIDVIKLASNGLLKLEDNSNVGNIKHVSYRVLPPDGF